MPLPCQPKSLGQERRRLFLENRHCTRILTQLKGFKAPPVQGLVPRTRKRSKKSSENSAFDSSKQAEVNPHIPFATLQNIGAMLEIAPEDLSVQKLVGSMGEATSKTVSDGE